MEQAAEAQQQQGALTVVALANVKKGAVGYVVMGKVAATGDAVAIKYHCKLEPREKSIELLKILSNNEAAREYIACLPRGLSEEQLVFKDEKRYPGYPYAMVLKGGDQTLQDILDELGPVSDTDDSGTRSTLPENHARFMFECLANAVHFVHGAGYVHHDLKAQNFVKFFDGRYRLIDMDNCRKYSQEDMGNTTAEICPPEMARVLAQGASGKPLKAAFSQDIWALGCVLYQLVTNRLLLCDLADWPQSRKFRNEDALEVWCSIEDKDIKRVLDRQVAPVGSAAARELLAEMLKRNPASRCDLQHVLASNFLRGDATLGVIQEHYKALSSQVQSVACSVADIQQRIVLLADLPAQIRQGFTEVGSQIGNFRSMVLELHESECPSTFVISPDVMPADALAPASGVAGAASDMLSSWTGSMMDAFTGGMSLSKFAESLKYDKFRLHLVCERCCVPQGEGYVIKKPKEWIANVMPALQVSLAVCKVANFALRVGSIMFPGMPTIPAGVLAQGDALLSDLGARSSAEEFKCVQGPLDNGETNGDTFQEQHDASLRLLHAFLNQNDPNREWAGLALVDLGNDTTTTASSIDAPADKQVLWCCKACITGANAADAGSTSKRSSKMVPKADYDKLHTSLREAEEEVRRLKHIVQSAGLEVPVRRHTGEQQLIVPRRHTGEQLVLTAPAHKGSGSRIAASSGRRDDKVADGGMGGNRGASKLLDCFMGRAGAVHPDPPQ